MCKNIDQLGIVADARHVAEEYLHGGSKKPLSGSVKVNSGLYWRSQDVGYAIATRQREL